MLDGLANIQHTQTFDSGCDAPDIDWSFMGDIDEREITQHHMIGEQVDQPE
jgi:hypothetical protein